MRAYCPKDELYDRYGNTGFRYAHRPYTALVFCASMLQHLVGRQTLATILPNSGLFATTMTMKGREESNCLTHDGRRHPLWEG